MPYENYKNRQKAKAKIKEIDNHLNSRTVEVYPIQAQRIALAKEYEDEGDLYLVETDDCCILYLWDNDYNLKKNFPCLVFEIYNEKFYKLIGRQVNPLSEKIKPIVIDAKSKWAYLKKVGGPDHLSIEKRDFDKLVDQIKNIG